MPLLQDVIHKLEVGGGMRYVRVGLGILALITLIVGYNWRAFRNMHNMEAMDAAQVARNLAEGKGYSTLFVRPFSMYLVKKKNQGGAGGGGVGDLARIKTMHPDLANPPAYPVVLAGLLKVAHLRYAVDQSNPFWSTGGSRGRMFYRYKPDFLIGIFNQALFFASIALLFLLARKLFDSGVAWLSSIFFLGNELFWRFSVSGLSTMFLLLIFLGLIWVVVLFEEEARVPKLGPASLSGFAAAAGVLVGVGGLTRYSFGWLIIPLLVFVILFGGPRRVLLAFMVLTAFLVVMGPWVARNFHVSGTPFGISSFTLLEGTYVFPEYRLQRSLEPNLSQAVLSAFWQKLITNTRQILQSEVPKLGGTWVSALFLAGLLVGFRSPGLKRLRYFVVGSLGVFIIAQALGRTQLSEDSPEINSENLLVLIAPITLMYGVSLFFILVDRINMPFPQIRYFVVGIFSIAACFPMIFVFLPPKTNPVAYPPYYPPAIQTVAGWLKENELVMSDIPWAVAWYGERQSVWLTLKATPDAKDPTSREDFFAINDYQKPINVLYLTPQTMDSRFLTQWIRAGEQSWGSFILDSIVKKKVPDYFPLNQSQSGWLPEQLVLADWERWRKSGD